MILHILFYRNLDLQLQRMSVFQEKTKKMVRIDITSLIDRHSLIKTFYAFRCNSCAKRNWSWK